MQISVYSISFGFSWGPIGEHVQHAIIICVLLNLWPCVGDVDHSIPVSVIM